MFYVLFLLSRKAIIVALFISLIFIFFLNFKEKINRNKVLILTVVFTAILVIFSPVLKKRFNEVFLKVSYEKINENNSTSIRFGVYNCSLKLISENILFGYGIGDVNDELQKCYLPMSRILTYGNYNSHNQYFSYALSNGIFGAFLLLIILVKGFFIGYKTRNNTLIFVTIFYFIAFFFENILERQSGVILFMFLICLFCFNIKNLKEIEK
jgi:O-antigen ligase